MAENRSSLPLLALLAAAIVFTGLGAAMLFSTFMVYDDEGYVLFSLKNYAQHGHLYGQVYSQYGPFPYALYDGLHALGLPFTHTASRLVTLLAWSGSALFSALAVWRLSRNSCAGFATLAGTFVYLWAMVNEPSHPGGLIALITAVVGGLGTQLLFADKPLRWAALVGAGCAALALTKINVGAFALLSTVAFCSIHSSHPLLKRHGPWMFSVLFALLPFALMRPLLGVDWVQAFAGIYALSAFTAVLGAGMSAPSLFDGRAARRAIVAGLAVAAVIICAVACRGTTAADFIEGIFLGPLRHPSRFNLAFRWPAAAWVVTTLSAVLFVAATVGRTRPRGALVHELVSWLRVGAAAALTCSLLRFPGTNPNIDVLAYGAPTLWLFTWPLPNETGTALTARRWMTLLFLGQMLHAYPVPGSQIGWGTFLVIPIAVTGTWSALRFLRDRHPLPAGWIERTTLLGNFACVAAGTLLGAHLFQLGRSYSGSRELNLPGAESLRLPDANTAAYQILTLNSAAHTDMVFSLPGMFSFNLWADLPAPTLANVTHWFSLLDANRQEAIVRSLEAHPRAGYIVHTELVKYLETRGFAPHGPLHEYLARNFLPVFTIDGFQFCVRADREILPLQTAEFFERTASHGEKKPDFDSLLTMNLLLPAGQHVARIDLATMDDRLRSPLSLSADNCRIEVHSTNLHGELIAPETRNAFPIEAVRPALVSIYFNRGSESLSPDKTLIVLRDTAGRELALVRLRR